MIHKETQIDPNDILPMEELSRFLLNLKNEILRSQEVFALTREVKLNQKTREIYLTEINRVQMFKTSYQNLKIILNQIYGKKLKNQVDLHVWNLLEKRKAHLEEKSTSYTQSLKKMQETLNALEIKLLQTKCQTQYYAHILDESDISLYRNDILSLIGEEIESTRDKIRNNTKIRDGLLKKIENEKERCEIYRPSTENTEYIKNKQKELRESLERMKAKNQKEIKRLKQNHEVEVMKTKIDMKKAILNYGNQMKAATDSGNKMCGLGIETILNRQKAILDYAKFYFDSNKKTQ